MIILFDYCFYRFCQFYLSRGEKGVELSSLALLSVFQCLNVFSLYPLIAAIFGNLHSVNIRVVAFIVSLGALFLNNFRYKRITSTVLDERWKEDDPLIRNIKGKRVVFYLVASILLGIVLICRKYIFGENTT